ncbi:YhfR [Planococcus halocryophilus Or1]|uniref:Histidine phosphatase family protein n=1 Tax=Planococcus halocryophilus TaxID=1215089 RepID=A0A1C7DPH3_9BACL|nr:histidine phosphatase family protein [Planococcus halocryophilus]ANU13113.1 histidine phosphatase family protein [Planococcus halocryophilus]EMF47917.1 YhfR [Planococcus halocryophilus Or1]
MTMICLVRHGETDWNVQGKIQGKTDIPLNTEGMRQAARCAHYLTDSNWDVIITSPLKRAKGTALLINEKLQLPLIEMPEFEEKHFGDAEGMTYEERELTFPDRHYPNQEDNYLFAERLSSGLQIINECYQNKRVLLVSHGGVINALLGTLSKGEIGSGKTRLLNACFSHIQFDQTNWVIENYNQVSHLEKVMSGT